MSDPRCPVNTRGGCLAVVLLLGLCIQFASRLEALIFYSSGSRTFNTSAPTGALSASGWQFQGRWGSFLGTPVGPSHFLTAKHVGGTVGGLFSWDGTNYTTVGKVDHPTADLTLWRVSSRFPRYAPLYTASSETGRSIVVFGRGLIRGAEVRVANASPMPLRGWQWGSGSGVMRWGENRVDGVVVIQGAAFLAAGFDRTGGVNEATLASGDSGGAVFIWDGGTWKLAGINYGVESDFAATADQASFRAAIFDAGGLFYGASISQRFFVPDQPADVRAAWVATRVSAYSAWIRSTAGLP